MEHLLRVDRFIAFCSLIAEESVLGIKDMSRKHDTVRPLFRSFELSNFELTDSAYEHKEPWKAHRRSVMATQMPKREWIWSIRDFVLLGNAHKCCALKPNL